MEKYLQLRHEYMACIKLADETDSKKEDAHLRKEASEILEELKSICPHNHILILNSEYAGSYLEDFSDAEPERRVCLCCSIREGSRWDGIKILINRPIARFEKKYSKEFEEPLRYYLSDLIEKAEASGYRV